MQLTPEQTAAISRRIILMNAEATLPERDMRNVTEDAVTELGLPAETADRFMADLIAETAQVYPHKTVEELQD